MRHEDLQTIAVMLFEQGMAPSDIDSELRLRKGFAYETILEWWMLMDERNEDQEKS